MRFLIKYSIIIAANFFAIQSFAQRSDSTIANQRIDIIQTYTPEVKMPEKPVIKPSAVQYQEITNRNLEYNVPAQPLSFNYDAVEIKPLALGKFPEDIYYQNYAALGLGNFRTILGDLGLTYHEDGVYDAYIHGYHFSQKGGKIEDRKSSNTDVRLGGKYFLKKYELDGVFRFNRRGVSYYGYDHDYYTIGDDSLSQVYSLFEFSGGLGKINISKYGLGFEPKVNVYYYKGKQNGNERGFGWQAPISYGLTDDWKASLSFDGLLTSYNHTSVIERYNHFLQLHPSVSYNNDRLLLDLGAALVTTSRNGYGWLPKINVRYALGQQSRAALSAGWDGDVIMYSFRNLTTKNPFMNYLKTDNGLERRLYGGVELAMLQNLKIQGKITYHNYSRFNMYLNDYVDVINPNNYFFNEYMDDVNIFSLKGGAQWLITNIFELGGGFTYFAFPTESDRRIYHEPSFILDAVAKVRPVKGLTIVGNLDFLSGIRYREFDGSSHTLNPAANLSFNAEYEFLERFGAFVTFDNVLNSNYQRWHKYEVYGFNIFGGVKVKF